MIVATATDRGFLELACVMLASLAGHAPEVERVHVFGLGLTRRDRARIAASYGRPGLTIHDADAVIGPQIRSFPLRRRITAATYARIFIPEALPYEQGRLVYLDADVVLNGPIDALETIDMEGFAVAACVDAVWDRDPEWNARLGSPPDTRYFNAGVLLIDLAAWRRDDLTRRLTAFILARPEGLAMMDQDALNGTLAGCVKVLDDRWNAYYPSKVPFEEMDPGVFAAARIVHFVGRHKPNQKENLHPARALFLTWRAKTPFADARMLGPRERKLRAKLARRAKALKDWARGAVSPHSR